MKHFLSSKPGTFDAFQHSLKHGWLQTEASVHFRVAVHDSSTLQSRNMHNMNTYNLFWAPVFRFVHAFQILYMDYGKRLRENFHELWSGSLLCDGSNYGFDIITY